jgi:hypothetical protein
VQRTPPHAVIFADRRYLAPLVYWTERAVHVGLNPAARRAEARYAVTPLPEAREAKLLRSFGYGDALEVVPRSRGPALVLRSVVRRSREP